MRRTRLIPVLGLVLALVAASCGDPKTDNQSGRKKVTKGNLADCPMDALRKATSPVKVTLWYSGLSAKPLDTLKSMVQEYNASQNKVVVQAENQGPDYDSGLAKVKGAVKT